MDLTSEEKDILKKLFFDCAYVPTLRDTWNNKESLKKAQVYLKNLRQYQSDRLNNIADTIMNNLEEDMSLGYVQQINPLKYQYKDGLIKRMRQYEDNQGSRAVRAIRIIVNILDKDMLVSMSMVEVLKLGLAREEQFMQF